MEAVATGFKQTKIGEMPEEWEVVRLDGLCSIEYGKDQKKVEKVDGKYKILGTGGLMGNTDHFLYDKPSVLIGRKGTIDKPQYINEPFWTVDTLYYTKIFDVADPKWFFYYITTIPLKSYNEATGVPSLSRINLYSIKIPLPPLHEQKKIAKILSTVDEAIEQTQSIIAETQKLKKGLMQHLFTKGIGHTKFKQTKIGEMPEEWEVVRLGDTASPVKHSFTGGPFGSNLKSEEYTKTGVRIIQLQNIGDGVFLDNYKIFTSEQKANELISCNIYPGDIILAKMADPVARACLMPCKDSRYVMASDGIRLNVDEDTFDKLYVLYAINSPYFRKNAENHSTGTTRLRIGLVELRNLEIFSPPLPEQKKIAEILSEVDNKIEEENTNLKELQNLKKGLMQVLLTGKVRVK